MTVTRLLPLLVCLNLPFTCAAGQSDINYPALEKLYRHLHQNPELSFKEEKTAARIADELANLGFKVTRNFGGHGIVGVFKNGQGPTVLLRTDLDALPIAEATGLAYASKARSTDIDGETKPVMHACGHDVHMTVFVGAAKQLISARDRWRGTLIMIGQPAEERGSGAKAMLDAGLFKKFPRPDYNLALHVKADLPAGQVAYVAGAALANVDSMDITLYGVGGHGAYPHTTKDPIMLAAQVINNLQSIVSREISPLEPAVITVGSIHGGHKHNIIPDEVKLQLTLRSYNAEVRAQMIAAIKRRVHALAEAAGMPEDKLPVISLRDEFTPVTYNDPALTERVVKVFQTALGAEHVIPTKPVMGGEDFSRYGMDEPKIPSLMFWLGAIDPQRYQHYQTQSETLPSLHSPFFAPHAQLSITTGVKAMTAAALALFDKP